MPLQTMEHIKLAVKPDVSRVLTKTSRFLTEKGIPAYLVGGFVRDMLLGRDTVDIDIAIGADALTVAAEVAGALCGKYVPLDAENRIGRVALTDIRYQIDFSTLKGNIEQDLARRDFTVNAMAIRLDRKIGTSLDAERLIDPFQGRRDLDEGTVKAVSDTVFADDAVRLIRAVRIAAELGFHIHSYTENLISQYSRLIAGIPGERVREELLRLLALPGAGARLAYMDKLGLLTALIPELAPAKGVDQPKVHVWDVFDHSIQTVVATEFLLREAHREYAGKDALAGVPWSTRLCRYFDEEISAGSTRRSLLKLAALLHDISKPQTKTIDDEGRARFLGHPQEGAACAAAIMERLRFSKREVRLVELLVKYHLRPTQMSHEGIPTRRAIYRYLRDLGEAGIDLLFLSLADHLATRGTSLDFIPWQEHAQMTAYVLDKHFEEESLSKPPKLIDGHDVMNTFGLSPGPKVGELLEALREAQAAGEVTNKQEALHYVKRLLKDVYISGTNQLGE
jgi:poly(A) polymerase